MLLFYAISFICGESITEGLILRHCPAVSEILFLWWAQWLIAIGLFAIWLFVFALPFDGYYVPTWKLIAGFVFVRFLIFDVVWNLVRGVKWNYYGNKLYDRIMASLGSFGWFLKAIWGIVGTCFLMGIN